MYLSSGTQFGGFHYLLILGLLEISFHVVVFKGNLEHISFLQPHKVSTPYFLSELWLSLFW